ncbi:MAG: hypothetical protein M3N19_06825 [Candidatus Eremiobacteraeota bacterium]|nr:hypothetical protein [Candidatus Eremiobacteraeota bacterium]
MRNAVVALLLAVWLLWPVAARADCSSLQGQRVILISNNYDPDVLLWDSKQRLMDYAAGSWDVAKILLPHALLARAGTKALLMTCLTNAVHLKSRLAPTDAAALKITSGPYKGRYAWVMADDLRPAAARAATSDPRPHHH